MASNKDTKLSLETKIKHLTEDGIDFDNKTIFLTEEFEDCFSSTLRMKVSALLLYWKEEKKKPLKELTLDINSPGGSIYAVYGTLDFYGELKAQNILVNTKAQGMCMSAATLLLCGGTGLRTVSKRCKLMLHDIQAGNQWGSATQIQAYADSLTKEQKELFRLYIELYNEKLHLAMTEKEIDAEANKWLKKFANNSIEHYINADKAIELKLADEII